MLHYQLVQQLKTKQKVLTVYDNVEDCRQFASQEAITYVGQTYIGNFPIFNGNNKVYLIRGLVPELNIICSIPKEQLAMIV